MTLLFFLAACSPGDDAPGLPTPSGPQEVPWNAGVPVPDKGLRGLSWQRSIVHLHSPYSHDACDGMGLIDGVPNAECLAAFREGLCVAGIDVAFVTDHPSHAAEQTFEDLFHHHPGDTWVEEAGERIANRIACENGREVLYLFGIEDELMPVGLERHVAGDDAVENDRIYNGNDTEALTEQIAAGGAVLVAHTEGRDLTQLLAQQADGLTGVEVFNLHASFNPGIRGDDLGLDPLGWASGIAPFTSPDATGEPDLFVLGVLEEQTVSVEKWEALVAVGPATAVGGTDAHQNVLAIDLRDGERGDSYRRMLRWFSNWIQVADDTPAGAQAALETGRNFLVFEILGTPTGLDVHLEDDAGVVHEVGSTTPEGVVVVGCPTLHPESPQGLDEPEIAVLVYKDGSIWQEGCGEYATDGPGVYRVRVDISPHHLLPFLGDDPDPYLRPFPWVYSNALRVGL